MKNFMNAGRGTWKPSMHVLTTALYMALVGYFYDGMSSSMKQILETMCGGDFMSKNPEEAMDFLSYVSEVSRGWDEPTNREIGKRPVQQMSKGGMYNLSEDMEMKAKSFEHMVEECPTIPAVREMFGEQANLIGQWKPNSNAPYGNTYNSSWRNHPNFAWKPRPNPYQSPAQSSNRVKVNPQLSKHSGIQRRGFFKGEGRASIITLRSGKEVHQPEHDQRKAKEDKADRNEEKKNERKGKEVQMKESIIPSMDEEPQILLKEGMMKKHMPPPFPQALRGKKPIKNASEILDVLRQVKVNIPLLDMIKQVPTYAKFLKDLCTVKRGLNVTKQAFLTEQVSAIIQCKSPIKYKDPGCPTISVNIGGTQVEKALLDLGASVNLLPYSVYKELGLGELKSTSITLSLADRSVKIPGGNGVMQLTFGNMTLELNIFHLSKAHPSEEDEGPEEVCMIDTLVEEHCNQSMLDQFEESLNESLEVLEEGLPEPSDVLAIMSPWRRKEEILPLFNEEDLKGVAREDPPKLVLKPFPVDLNANFIWDPGKLNPDPIFFMDLVFLKTS
ncbi:hypothetical protein CK203_109871 [Vitis vinifera]|uniref:Retrotransposon gag domain-containing protein n=1 Tax=Vitis vinifera TaxID=29760 RepID=A0A438E520_VITVI|nr:hypothetical protein CK203_109871 [Vitis vinifera]